MLLGSLFVYSLIRNFSENRSVTEIQKIINSGANVNAINDIGFTPLHIAVVYDRPEIVKLLLKNGANIDAVTKNKENTSLHLAITMNNSNMVRILIQKGADVTLKTADGTTPLQLALEKGNRDIIQAIEQGK
jgi:ankyrin repeat protein